MSEARTHTVTISAPLAPETPCVHCGLPVGPRPVLATSEGDSLPSAFCCTGCRVVSEALGAAGLGETYYRLRGVATSTRTVSPGGERPAKSDALQLAELDTEAFLAQHTTEAAEGLRRTQLFLDGVHCAACVWLVERLPFEMDGVAEAVLDLPRARLSLTFDAEAVQLSEVGRWLARFGYAARPMRTEASGQRTEAERKLLVRLGVAWALAGNVMLLAFAFYAGLDAEADATMAAFARWVSLALAIPAVAYGAAPFFQRAWASTRLAWRARDPRRLHIDTPIALGIGVGTLHSAWATVSGQGEVWFDSITVLIAALLTARWLQLRSRRLAGDASERLLSLLPSMVRRVSDSGETVVARLDELARGETVEVPAGEVIPVDGIVTRGESQLNNAVLTGESRPVPVAQGDAIEAGATNLVTPLHVRVEATGEATRVGRLLKWVRDEEGRKARVVLLADRLSGYFALSVLSLAALTAVVWTFLGTPSVAAQHVVALLVITCPCAIGMATPLAMAVAAGRAARGGIFLKSDAATQRLTEADTLVLDKTGTLTEGRMTLVETVAAEGVAAAAALDLAAVLEADVVHPIATALVAARGCPGQRAEGVEAEAGQGVRGIVDGHAVVVGRPSWVWAQRGEASQASADAALADAVERFAEAGHTPVAIALDGQLAAVCAIGDRLRDDALAVLRTLDAAGLTIYLCSGDHPAAVAAVARTLGIPTERAHGGVAPEAKRAAVEALQAEGQVVVMVGDGVNDAAALRAADVGVAVGGGSTASLVAADVFLTRPGLAPLAEAFAGTRHTLGVVRRNLGISLVYNVGGAAAAMLGLVTPLVAAVAMPISSLLVVASSILQRSFPNEPGNGRAGEPAHSVSPTPRLAVS
ncbi:MAG: heavy metal translocating P-type ATPase [Bacteroidota bacterium]